MPTTSDRKKDGTFKKGNNLSPGGTKKALMSPASIRRGLALLKIPQSVRIQFKNDFGVEMPKESGLSLLDATWMRYIMASALGDLDAFKVLLDRLDGKPIPITQEDDTPEGIDDKLTRIAEELSKRDLDD